MNPGHWYQPAIIRLLAIAILLATVALPAHVHAQTAPCVSCLVIAVSDADLAAAGQMTTGSLKGVQLLLAATAETDALAATGADIAVLIEPPDAASPQALLFDAKTTLTAVRADRPAVRIVIDGSRFAARGVSVDTLKPYVDAIIGVTWRQLPRVVSPSVDDLVSASLESGGERVVLPATHVDWNAVREFAIRRAALVEVSATRQLDVSEVLARYQAQQQRQDAIVTTTIARGSTTLMFEVPDFAAPITITAATTVFRSSVVATTMEQRDIRVNGVPIAGGNGETPPQLPLVDAERVTVPPLRLTLNDTYEYTLAGEDTVAGTACYVVTFEPRASGRGVVRGRAWIAATDFTLRRLQTIQRGLHGAIVSSEQVDEFGPVHVGAATLWLPRETRIFQTYEGAGVRTPIHRTVIVDSYDINSEGFDALLTAALTSDHVIIRETPAGLRYLVRRGKDGPRETTTRGASAIRSVIGGVLVDPSITRPLAFAGLSYVNLDLFGRGGQINAFFGGVVGQLSWTMPDVAGTRWQAHGSASGIAARYTDRVFRNGREQYTENLLQQPGYLSFGVLRTITPRVRASMDYVLDVTAMRQTADTPGNFILPRTIVDNGAVVAVDADRGAWTIHAWWNPVTRYRWRPWGLPGTFDRGKSDFQRYGVRVRRSIAVRPSVSSRLELSWAGGHDLDRFSRFGFDSFDNLLHGYPTASIRYDRGAVMRSATAVTMRGVRVDAFGDAALVHDVGWASGMRAYPGVGTGIESGGPFRTLMSLEWAYGFRGPRVDGGRGTQTLRLTLYKPF